MDQELLGEAFQVGIKKTIFNAGMREARLALGLRQQDLGKKVGLSGITISAIEGFRTYPTEKARKDISRALGQREEKIFPAWLEVYKLKYSTTTDVIDYNPLELSDNEVLSIESNSKIDDSIDKEILTSSIDAALEQLSDREKRIIKMRFGLGEYEPHTLEEVGNVYAVTKDRIRQIEAKALAKIRKSGHKEAKKLKEIYDLSRA